MNTKTQQAMFSSQSDQWTTPRDLFDELDAEFGFDVDAAADGTNALCGMWYGPDSAQPDALAFPWKRGLTYWLNPPYSRCKEFIAKAAREAKRGCTVVCLVPSRTDTRWWHDHVWDREKHTPKRGVQVRFIKGRLRFGPAGTVIRQGHSNTAPFPSVVIVFSREKKC